MIVGTAGHIDHGKTTLVKALTGVDADRLPEEKARGITLDLGYAYTDEGRLGFIDVPGHEKLVHNMLAGATGIDFLLLVVAADDGPMPQTREHLAIARLLGIRRGAVALTKADRVSPQRLEAARAEVATMLADSEFADLPLFAVAAPSGQGVGALKDHLLEAARTLGQRRDEGGFRLSIDRVFTLKGVGLVVTGTAFAGRVTVGDTLVLSPPGQRLRVRGMHVQDQPAESGHAGQRIALNLAGDVAKEDVARGMWLVASRLHVPVTRFQAEVRSIQALRHWQPLHVHLGAADVTGRLALLEGETLAPGQTMLAEIILDKAMGVLAHDRFVLRDQSASHTLGGGTVLDIFPPARHKRAPARLAALRLMALPDPSVALLHLLEQRAEGLDVAQYALNRNLENVEDLMAGSGSILLGEAGAGLAFSGARWQQLRDKALAALQEAHQREPDMIGLERDRLRRLTLPALTRVAFERLLADLLAEGRIAQTGGWLHLPEHQANLAAADRSLWQTLKSDLDSAPFQPPRVRDMAKARGIAEDSVRQLLKRAARVGLAYPVAHDHYFTAEVVAELAAYVDQLCAEHGAARAADLRDRIGGGRKVAIHILEFFDRVGYTRRVRDEHVVRELGRGRQWIVQVP